MSINGVVTLPPISPVVLPPSAMPPFSVSEIRKRTHAVQEIMRGVMKDGTHYGIIPGTPKPSLWKAGAEVLCMTFRLAPLLESRVTVDDPEGEWSYTSFKRDGSIVNGTCVGFFEVEASCTIHGPQSEVLSRCSARCNNREAKFRSLSMFEIRNTVQKMAEKRAFVSAVLMATGASDIFTQDLEGFPELVETQTIPTKHALLAEKTGEAPNKRITTKPNPSAGLRSRGQEKVAISPRQEIWLLRAAAEGQITEAETRICLDYLSQAGQIRVREFFDDLAKSKSEALVRLIQELKVMADRVSKC